MQRLELRPGQRFNRYAIVGYAGVSSNGKTQWLCRCDCGNERIVVGSNLSNGHIKSCGCLKAEVAKARMTTHGHHPTGKQTPEYTTWCNIKIRCYNTEADNYAYYGGRGIRVCDRWLNSFENFLSDMGERPSRKHTIDRKNNDGNYEPNNCRWITMLEQCANRRKRRRHKKPKG